MNVRVVYLGPSRDWAGVESESVTLDAGSTVGTLVEIIIERHPALDRARSSLRFAVNCDFATEDQPLADGDEIAVIPPVSGGCADDLIDVVDVAIDFEAIRKHVSGDTAAGGIVTFDGVTRFEEHPENGGLVHLEYEAYGQMAIKQMRRLAANAREQWPVRRLAIVHRTGDVPCGASSVIISVACAHRKDAFEACRWLIDQLKVDVPIWKKEVWSKGESTWVDPTATGPSDAEK
jgi:MoaE-MoaD fusion protein